MAREDTAARTLSLLFEAGHLKRVERTGWVGAGARRESLADHSFGTAFIALALSRMEGLDRGEEAELLRMALLHDLHEARVGDLSRLQKEYVRADYEKASRDMLCGTALSGEESGWRKQKLALLCKDADRLDMLLWAVENELGGNKNMAPFIATAKAEIKSESGKRIAALALKRLR